MHMMTHLFPKRDEETTQLFSQKFHIYMENLVFRKCVDAVDVGSLNGKFVPFLLGNKSFGRKAIRDLLQVFCPIDITHLSDSAKNQVLLRLDKESITHSDVSGFHFLYAQMFCRTTTSVEELIELQSPASNGLLHPCISFLLAIYMFTFQTPVQLPVAKVFLDASKGIPFAHWMMGLVVCKSADALPSPVLFPQPPPLFKEDNCLATVAENYAKTTMRAPNNQSLATYRTQLLRIFQTNPSVFTKTLACLLQSLSKTRPTFTMQRYLYVSTALLHLLRELWQNKNLQQSLPGIRDVDFEFTFGDIVNLPCFHTLRMSCINLYMSPSEYDHRLGSHWQGFELIEYLDFAKLDLALFQHFFPFAETLFGDVYKQGQQRDTSPSCFGRKINILLVKLLDYFTRFACSILEKKKQQSLSQPALENATLTRIVNCLRRLYTSKPHCVENEVWKYVCHLYRLEIQFLCENILADLQLRQRSSGAESSLETDVCALHVCMQTKAATACAFFALDTRFFPPHAIPLPRNVRTS